MAEDNVEEMVATAEKAPEPGTMTRGQIIHSEEGEVPSDKVVAALTSAGYVYVYDTKTGERSVINNNMLRAQLEKKRPDGTRVFSTTKPKASPHKGSYKCWLHPDDPNRERYDKYGLPVCMSAHLASPMEVELHMQKKHKRQYEIIQREKDKEEKERDREFQRYILEGIKGSIEKAPLYVSEKDKAEAKNESKRTKRRSK